MIARPSSATTASTTALPIAPADAGDQDDLVLEPGHAASALVIVRVVVGVIVAAVLVMHVMMIVAMIVTVVMRVIMTVIVVMMVVIVAVIAGGGS